MTKVTVVPETKSSMTQTEIGYSIKIAKQAIKTGLEKKIKITATKMKDLRERMHSTYLDTGQMQEVIQRDFALYVNNDSAMHCLVTAYNFLNPDEHIEQALDLLVEWDIYFLVRKLESLNTDHIGALEKIVKDRQISVDYRLGMGTFDKTCLAGAKQGHNGEFLNLMTITDYCPEMILNAIEERIPMLLEMKTLEDIKYNLMEKLENVPNTLEEVESQLLIQELSSSESGKKVLSITQGIIEDVVDNQALLASGTTTPYDDFDDDIPF